MEAENGRQKKKILILTLGVGDLLFNKGGEVKGEEEREKEGEKEKGEEKEKEREKRNKRIRDRFDEAKFAYRLTKYSFGEGEPIESEFVAKPLCEKYHPDLVFVLGTAKSGWSGFYRKFCRADRAKGEEEYKKHVKNTIRLDEIEQTCGINTQEEELKTLQDELGKIFSEFRISDNGAEEVKPILTCYGVDDKQLKDNYNILSGMIRDLDRSADYEVAFDITHSFRSLPLYNYIILHYFKHISKHRIEISHIYYGNVDIIRETEGVAPVVDLRNLANVLELTEGVSEFKNTGSTVTLSANLEKNGLKDLNKALREFDMAAQLNDFGEIVSALDTLKKELLKTHRGKGSYADLGLMIKEVLERDFPNERCGKDLIGFGTKPEKKKEILKQCRAFAYFQFLLTKWHLKQNRYGVTIATALEALRSYLGIFYLKEELTEESLQEEQNRKDAEKELRSYPFSSPLSERLSCLQNIAVSIDGIKKVRNTFAHNLNKDADNQDIFRQLYKPAERIKTFVDRLEELVQLIEAEDEELKAVFDKIYENPDPAEGGSKELQKTKKESRIRLLISKAYKSEYKEVLFESKKKRYHVYRLSEELEKALKDKIAPDVSKKERTQEDLVNLAIKLSRAVKVFQEKEGVENLVIVFDSDLSGIEEYVYAYILKKENRITNFLRYSDANIITVNSTGVKILYKKKDGESFKKQDMIELKQVFKTEVSETEQKK